MREGRVMTRERALWAVQMQDDVVMETKYLRREIYRRKYRWK
jgi:hypothetical protein